MRCHSVCKCMSASTKQQPHSCSRIVSSTTLTMWHFKRKATAKIFPRERLLVQRKKRKKQKKEG